MNALCKRLGYFVLALAACLLPAAAAQAQLSFSLRTGNDAAKTQSMVFDSNKGCDARGTEGPKAMFLGGMVTNNGATTATNVTAVLSGFTSNFFLAGGQPPSLNLGSIAPGQSAGAFWLLGYGCTEVSAPLTVSVTSSAGASSSSITVSGTSTLSANATGFLESSLLGPGAVVGQTIYLDVGYSFGGTDPGDEFYLQPTGLATFNAPCFRLVGNEIIASDVTGIDVGIRNRSYFVQTEKQTKKADVTSRYYFAYLCEGATTSVRPYAMGTSGQLLKYTGNYDSAATSFTITFPGATNPFVITKSSDLASGPYGVRTDLTYTVTVTNPSPYASRISRFVDVLPAGAKFKSIHPGSDVKASTSSSVPAVGATGTLTFEGVQDFAYLIPAGGSVKLVYTASMPPQQGTYVNSAQAQFGLAGTPFATASFEVLPPLPLTVVKSSQTASDPLNGTTDPKSIPGARMLYTVLVANPNDYTVTTNSIEVVDKTPPNLSLYVADLAAGAGPVLFQNGSAPSGLNYTFTDLASQTDDVDFSQDGGVTWTYVPVPNGAGADPNVTHVRVRPKAAMAPASSFNLLLSYVLG